MNKRYKTLKGGDFISQTTTTVTQDLEAINRFTRRTLKDEEVYRFNVTLCDNDIDRDLECFPRDTLHALAPLFVGKTGIFDHNAKAENQTARIYATEVVVDTARKTSYGEPYAALCAKAYLMRNDKNKALIDEIDAGIKKEVSIGCSVAESVCSVCGSSTREGGCAHQAGQRYDGILCYHKLLSPTDAYEWSFVAVPAQQNAGVTKGFQRDWNTLTKVFSKAEGITLTKQEVTLLNDRLATLEADAALAKEYRKKLCQTFVNTAYLAGETVSPALLEGLAKRMTTAELTAFTASYQSRLTDGATPQLLAKKAEQPNKNQSFQI